jgi:hypothetical protein
LSASGLKKQMQARVVCEGINAAATIDQHLQ